MVKYISTRKLRQSLAAVMKDVTTHFDRYIILKRGEPEAVLMSIEDYEGWLETLEIMSSPNALEDIRIAKEELKQGQYYSFEEVFGKSQKKSKKTKK